MNIKAKAPFTKGGVVTSSPKLVAIGPALKKSEPKTQRVTFSVRADVGREVYLAGSFNNWDPTAKAMADKKSDGVYTATLNLPAGAHQYKFVIDGTWCSDPECAERVQNAHGTFNSVKQVG